MKTTHQLLLKGNEALAMAAIRYGCDGYFGYPITPQTEILETLMSERPWKTTGMVVMQVESELAAINMLLGGGATGKRVMTSTSGPGMSLMQEGLSYMAGSSIPGLIVDVMRGGPGLGTIQPSQADYFQVIKGGGHGDYKLFTIAPSNVQEMADFVAVAFDWAFKYRNPAVILADGTIGQMMEKVELPEFRPRMTDDEIYEQYPWAATSRGVRQKQRILSSLELDPLAMEKNNLDRLAKYAKAEAEDVRYEEIQCDDAQVIVVAFGSAARICSKTVQIARQQGIRLGLIRPITLWPFPKQRLQELARSAQGFITVELNAGQMVEDVRLAVGSNLQVEHYGRMGGVVFTPEEILDATLKFFPQLKPNA